MQILQLHALLCKRVQIGRVDNGISGTSQIAVALVVRNDEDEVWCHLLCQDNVSFIFFLISTFS